MTQSFHPFERRTLQFIQRHHLVDPSMIVGVAVSGGPDSVALLHVLLSLKKVLSYRTLKVLHFDHELRGEDSAKDRLFVLDLASHLGCKVLVGFGDVRRVQTRQGVSLEMAARQCRREFFLDFLSRGEVHRIALGHTADDQAEEILLRLCRGTGPSGMQGMRPKTSEGLVRPLLWAHRGEILDYLKAKAIPFRQDATNFRGFCQRNRVRLEVIPLLEEIFHPRIRETLCRHAEQVAQEEAYWENQVTQAWKELVCVQDTETVVLDVLKMRALPEALSIRVFQRALEKMGYSFGIFAVHLRMLEGLLRRSSSGREVKLPSGIRAVKEGTTLVLTNRAPNTAFLKRHEFWAPGRYPLQEFQGEIQIEQAILVDDLVGTCPSFKGSMSGKGRADGGAWRDFEEGEKIEPTMHGHHNEKKGSGDVFFRIARFMDGRPGMEDAFTAVMDADTLRWPLVVRSFEPGDRFRPVGARGSKKLQDFFTDAKVPRSARRRVPLVCDQEKICWVVGHRLDDRVKVTERTQRILKIHWRPWD
ncbi:MAG: tRNA lysidine(34) synthetase TilS [Desulfosoma sp.]